MKSGKGLDSRFQAIEEPILDQVKSFGMTTRVVWGRSPTLQEFSPDDITQAIRSLTARGILEAHPLHHGRFYFALTKKAVQKFGSEEWSGGSFNERDKFRVFAKLIVGTFHLSAATPFSKSKLRSTMGDGTLGLPNHFMVQRDAKKIYYLRIDSAIRAFPARVAQQLRNDIFRLVKIGSIKHLIQSKQFELVLVTCTEGRSKAILQHFRSYDRVGGTPIQAVVVPELIPLVTTVPIGGAILLNNL